MKSPEVTAYDYVSRYTFGTFLSQENHVPDPSGATDNDFFTSSMRLYYKGMGVSKQKLSFVVDLRDKHDFFNKLDRENQQLSEKNDFQLRQLSIQKKGKYDHFLWQVGRFSVTNAGAAFTDGVELGYRLQRKVDIGVFAGLNPKNLDKEYLEFDSTRQIAGAYVAYQPLLKLWEEAFIFNNAFVSESVDGTTDRQYFYNYTRYQWAYSSSLTSNIYYDLEPVSKIQNGILTYNQAWAKSFKTKLSLKYFDIIESAKQEDLLFDLESSPYQELDFSVRWKLKRYLNLRLSMKDGVRSSDNLKKRTYEVILGVPRFFNKNFDGLFKVSQQKNFTKEGLFYGFKVGYFSKKWELELDADMGNETQTDGSELNPIYLETLLSVQWSKKLFGALSFQLAKNEQVEIYTSFFKIGYRMGSKTIAPVRDGAAPRGRF